MITIKNIPNCKKIIHKELLPYNSQLKMADGLSTAICAASLYLPERHIYENKPKYFSLTFRKHTT